MRYRWKTHTTLSYDEDTDDSPDDSYYPANMPRWAPHGLLIGRDMAPMWAAHLGPNSNWPQGPGGSHLG